MEILAEVTGIKEEWMENLAYDVLTFVSGESSDKVIRGEGRAYIKFNTSEEYYREAISKELWKNYERRRLMNGMKLNIKVLGR